MALLTQTWCLTIPVYLINRIAFSKLTEQPFIMLEIYWIDLLTFTTYCIVLSYHFKNKSDDNSAWGLEDPEPELKYVYSFGKDTSENVIGNAFFNALLVLFSFLRILYGL